MAQLSMLQKLPDEAQQIIAAVIADPEALVMDAYNDLLKYGKKRVGTPENFRQFVQRRRKKNLVETVNAELREQPEEEDVVTEAAADESVEAVQLPKPRKPPKPKNGNGHAVMATFVAPDAADVRADYYEVGPDGAIRCFSPEAAIALAEHIRTRK